MRHALAFIPGMPVREVVDLARRVEELGYDALYLPDQTFHRDPFVLLGLCAAATERIKLGLAVTNPYTRHPIQIARAAGLLAEVAEGRFVLGLGAGNVPHVMRGFGIAQTRVVARLREAVDVIRRLLAGETVDHHSATLTVDAVALDFAPPAPVPISIATRGPKLLALAGEVADGVMMEGLFTPGGLAWALARVAEGAARANRRVHDLDVVAWQAIELVDAPQDVEDARFKRWAALLIRTTAPDILREIGVSEAAQRAVAEEIEAGAGDPTGRGIAAVDVEKLLMVGTPQQIRGRLDELAAHGVGSVSLLALGDSAQVRTAMERYARDVLQAPAPAGPLA